MRATEGPVADAPIGDAAADTLDAPLGRKSAGWGRFAQVHEMHRRWPFFQTVLSNMAMVLAKSDLDIAARHCQLGSSIASSMSTQHAVCNVLSITGTPSSLLPDIPRLAESIRNRLPHLDPLHHLQVALLQPRER